eukprot:CAMPEP_0114598698 /NCGR_PEP_ID=MMETSP0125-20121206/21109_1 /TAXON_ID=485358 ORGANISM="Aristerostoma sp., Strain ATCC 50986" /NCGR_SAMPLE_ID=MMETSP0125 /ASSEMBLY_ACC=CAM_ASM_000245 /LENGTH=197 /DNA_ID=CAMNT_0001804771 /DNA_START=109 /DNA_END=703 /DNA_ORIENTATION=+
MGFDAIWISPIPLNFEGAYHGYAAIDFYKLNPNFGTQEDLTNMINAAHDAGLWVMLDVVANHVGPVGTDFSQIVPFNSSSNYHPEPNPKLEQSTEVQVCRLDNLPDLDQDDSTTRQLLLDWVKGIVANNSFDGLRVDTVEEVKPEFWKEYISEYAGVHAVGEVFNGDLDFVSGYQDYLPGLLNYPLFFTLRNCFISG